MAIDPVCGMDVDEQTAAGKSDHKGQIYYFCSPGCKRAFDKEPEKYIGQTGTKADDHSGQRASLASFCLCRGMPLNIPRIVRAN